VSSYDLLADKPEVTDEELPQELSGVLCRCTGYRNILSAVSEVAGTHREGIPGPRNCGRHALMGHTAGMPSAQGAQATSAPDAGTPGDELSRDVELPAGQPTFTVSVTDELEVSPAQVQRVFDDIDLLVSCLPGAELTEHLGADRYRGRARVSVGPIRLSFAGLAQVVERDTDNHRLRVIGQGRDAGGGSTQADIRLAAEQTDDGARLRADADVYLTGRIAQFGRALAGDVSRRMFVQFAASVQEAAISGTAPTGGRSAPSAMALLAGTMAGRLRQAFSRLRDRLRARLRDRLRARLRARLRRPRR
jgi:carbon-monoxide dehydrogenase small subunit